MTAKILKIPKMAWLRNGMQMLLVKGPDDTLASFEYETYDLQLKTQTPSNPVQLLFSPGI